MSVRWAKIRWLWGDWWPTALATLAGLLIVVGLPLAIRYEESESYQRPAYEAWMRLNHSDISFSDWNMLRQRQLLPGQSQEPNTIIVHTDP